MVQRELPGPIPRIADGGPSPFAASEGSLPGCGLTGVRRSVLVCRERGQRILAADTDLLDQPGPLWVEGVKFSASGTEGVQMGYELADGMGDVRALAFRVPSGGVEGEDVRCVDGDGRLGIDLERLVPGRLQLRDQRFDLRALMGVEEMAVPAERPDVVAEAEALGRVFGDRADFESRVGYRKLGV